MPKKKKIPVFYITLAAVVIVFVVILQIFLGIVREYLADYESSLPQYEAEKVFQKYYADGNYLDLVQASNESVTVFESPLVIAQYLAEYTTGKTLSYSSISTGLDTDIKYIVKADNVKISSFTLRHSGQKSAKGFDLYEVTAFEIFSAGNQSVRITVPVGDMVYINDVPVSDDFLTGNTTNHISCEHMPAGVSGIVYNEYLIEGLYAVPDSIRVLTADQMEVPVTEIESGVYHADIQYSEALQAEFSDYVIEAAQTLAAYMQNDSWFGNISPYIDPESELYTNIRTSETYWVIDHNSYSFENVRTSEFYAYDENTFSCRVGFTHVLHRNYSQDYKDYLDMTFYLRKIGDKFLIYDRYTH